MTTSNNNLAVFAPESPEALATWLTQADTPQGWCADPQLAKLLATPQWLDMRSLKAIRWYSPQDLTITVEAGISLADLQAALALNDQYWPFATCLPTTSAPHTYTLADFLATDGPGLEAGLIGYPRDWVLGTEVVTGSGVLSKAGGQVVKNVTGYDLNQLIVGSQHTLGVLTAVTLKLKRLPEVTATATTNFDDLTDAFRFADALLSQANHLYVCEIVQASRLDPKRRRDDAWKVVIELRGDHGLLASIKPMVNEMTSQLEWLTPADRLTELTSLQQWDNTAYLLEWAFPPPASLLLCRELFQVFGMLDRPTLQIRPAGGLLYTQWGMHFDPEQLQDGVKQVLHNLSALGISIRCVQSPEPRLYKQFNQPVNTGLAHVTQQLKTLYDPRHMLVNPHWPV
jgi:hypothetical protein